MTRSLGFPELFPTLPWSPLATSHDVQLTAWPSREPFDLNGLESDGPPWASLVLSAFGCLSWGPATCLILPRAILTGWTQSRQSSFACSTILLECLYRTVNVYYLLCICCIFCITACFSFLSLFGQIFQSKCLFQLSFNSIVQSLEYYLIIVQLLFFILILEMCSRYFDPIKK
jgi:hypothetical protein